MRRVYDGEYIRMNQIQQSRDKEGKWFACAYQDMGRFYLSVIDEKLEEVHHRDVSNLLRIDEESKPIESFWEPGTTAIFMPDNTILVQVYHRL